MIDKKEEVYDQYYKTIRIDKKRFDNFINSAITFYKKVINYNDQGRLSGIEKSSKYITMIDKVINKTKMMNQLINYNNNKDNVVLKREKEDNLICSNDYEDTINLTDMDKIIMLSKIIFYSNKLSKFTDYKYKEILKKINVDTCVRNERKGIDAFFRNNKKNIEKFMQDCKGENNIENQDKKKDKDFNELKNKIKILLPSKKQQINNMTKDNFYSMCVMHNATTMFYNIKNDSINDLTLEIDEYNKKQRDENKGEIEYGYIVDSDGKESMCFDIPYMNMPLKIHVVNNMVEELEKKMGHQINDYKLKYGQEPKTPDIIFFEMNMREINLIKKNSSLYYHPYVEQIKNRIEKDERDFC